MWSALPRRVNTALRHEKPYVGGVKTSPLQLAAIAVSAVDGLEAVGTRGPNHRTPDFQYGGVLDANGKHWVVKYPLHTHAGTTIEAEAAMVPELLEQLRAGNLPFDVLRPGGFTQVEHGRAMVYTAPLGRPIDFTRLSIAGSHELGRALGAIHSLPTETITNAGQPVYDAPTIRRRLLTELHDIDEAAPLPPVLRRRWENAIENAKLWNFEPRPVHGDVAPENFYWSEGSIVSVLGFGQAHVGDPAEDFAPLVSALGEAEFDAVRESYGNGTDEDEFFFARTVLLSEIALARWLMFGIRTNDSTIVADARNMLYNLAEEIDSDPELDAESAWTMDDAEVSPVTDASGFESVDPDDLSHESIFSTSAPSADSSSALSVVTDEADEDDEDDDSTAPRP